MGASSFEFKMKGTSTHSDIEKQFARMKQDNKVEYGNSGECQSFDGIDFTDKVFATYNDANEYILNNTEKWGNLLAVKYNYVNPKKNFETEQYWLIGGWSAD